MSMGAAAGWYNDGTGRQRWWNGSQWTDHLAPAAVDAPVYERVSTERKHEVASLEVARAVSNGGRVEFLTNDTAVVVHGHRANHVLHLILTLVTFGLWAFVWIIVALTSGESRSTLRVDDYGRPLWTRAR